MKKTAFIVLIIILSNFCWAENSPRVLNSRYYSLSCWGEDINEYSMGELLEENLLEWNRITGISPLSDKTFKVWIFSNRKDLNNQMQNNGIKSPQNNSFLLIKKDPADDILVILLPETIPAYQEMHLLIFRQIARSNLPLLPDSISRGLSHYLLQEKIGNGNEYLTLWKKTYLNLESMDIEQSDIFYWGLITYGMKSGDLEAKKLLKNLFVNSQMQMESMESPRWDNEEWQRILLKMHQYFTLQLTLKEKQDKAIELFDNEQWIEAQNAFLQLENAQISPLVSYYISLINFELKDFEKALESIELSYTQGLQEDLYLYCKGTILWETGERESAREFWNLSLEKSGSSRLYLDILEESDTFLLP